MRKAHALGRASIDKNSNRGRAQRSLDPLRIPTSGDTVRNTGETLEVESAGGKDKEDLIAD